MKIKTLKNRLAPLTRCLAMGIVIGTSTFIAACSKPSVESETAMAETADTSAETVEEAPKAPSFPPVGNYQAH